MFICSTQCHQYQSFIKNNELFRSQKIDRKFITIGTKSFNIF